MIMQFWLENAALHYRLSLTVVPCILLMSFWNLSSGSCCSSFLPFLILWEKTELLCTTKTSILSFTTFIFSILFVWPDVKFVMFEMFVLKALLFLGAGKINGTKLDHKEFGISRCNAEMIIHLSRYCHWSKDKHGTWGTHIGTDRLADLLWTLDHYFCSVC